MLQSPQALLDGITAAFYNAFFTALPIAAFAIWDRPVQNLDLLAEHPEAYNRKPKASSPPAPSGRPASFRASATAR